MPTQIIHSGILDHFADRLSYRPHAANRKDAFRPTWAEDALAMRYIAPERPTETSWLKFDVEGEGAAARWIDAGFPQPHLVVRDRHKDSAHYLYGLRTPLITGPNSRPLPRRLFTLTASGMTHMFRADPGYTGFGVKNPLSRIWRVDAWEGELYELRDLYEALPHNVQVATQMGIPTGAGRNCHLFSLVIGWAYSEVPAAHAHGNYAQWVTEVTRQAEHMNCYQPRLPRSEVTGLAKRIAKYTWNGYARRYTDEEVEQLKRSQRLSHLREHLTPEEATERMVEGANTTNAAQRSKRFDSITAAIGELVAEGFAQPSKKQIAQRAGVSESTVARHRAFGSNFGTAN